MSLSPQPGRPVLPRPPIFWPIVFGLVMGFILYRAVGGLWSSSKPAEPRAITPRGSLGERERSTIELFKNTAPAVVYITSIGRAIDLFKMVPLEIPQGSGSGFIWDKNGHIVTNYHVIMNASGAQVTLADHSTWKASLVGVAPDKDLAVLKIDAPADKLHPIPLGTSHDLEVGQSVFAIGNPFGLDQTLTTGVVSALNRTMNTGNARPIEGVVQTDAAINPGNSGGPLLDSAGRLIGVNTAIYGQQSAGIGFAVPVDIVSEVVPELIQHGKIVRPQIGVVLAEDLLARQLGVKEGTLVLGLQAGSAAAKAGLHGTTRTPAGIVLGDIIQKVDDHPVTSRLDYLKTLDHYKVGDTITLTVQRQGQIVTVPVVLETIE